MKWITFAIILLWSTAACAQIPRYANNGAACAIDTVEATTTQTCALPNPTGSGNLLVIWLRYHGSAQTPTFSDNITGNTYSLAKSVTDATNSTVSALYYVANVKAGVTAITMTVTSATFVQFQPYEFYNVATSTPLDEAEGQAGSGTAVSSPALSALGSSGDLIVQFGTIDNTATISSCTTINTQPVTWTFRETMIGNKYPSCLQYGVDPNTTSFAPSFNISTSRSWISIAAAFKSATAGTAPPVSGVRVNYVQHDSNQSEQATTTVLEYPISGNALAVLQTSGCAGNSSSDCAYLKSASDGVNTYTQITGSPVLQTGNACTDGGCSSGAAFYVKDMSPGAYIVTWTLNARSSGGIGSQIWLYDVSGANVNPLDTSYGTSGLASASFDQTGGGAGGPLTVYTATPSSANELIMATVGAAWDTWTGISSPGSGSCSAGGTCSQFLSVLTGSGGTTGGSNYNGGWGLYYNGASTAAQIWTWTHDTSTAGEPGAGDGIAMGIAFQAAPAPNSQSMIQGNGSVIGNSVILP